MPPRLDGLGIRYRISVTYRGVEQLVAREAHNLKAAGSSPAPASCPKEIWISMFRLDKMSRSVCAIMKNLKPIWSRLLAGVLLGAYLFALVALPAMHGHGCKHSADAYSANAYSADACCEHSEPNSNSGVSSNEPCPICVFAHLIVPFFTVSVPIPYQADIICKTSLAVVILSVACPTDLPPCRAPPLV